MSCPHLLRQVQVFQQLERVIGSIILFISGHQHLRKQQVYCNAGSAPLLLPTCFQALAPLATGSP